LAGMPHVKRAFVVHGEPGWDEATPVGRFQLFDVHQGRVHHEQRDPRDLGIARCKPEDLQGGDAEYNAAALEGVLTGKERGAHRDALVLGTALLLEVSGRVRQPVEGIEIANKAITDGSAGSFLKQLRAYSESMG
ncbi:unnamed protein product, partial [marine sediment metagenome]